MESYTGETNENKTPNGIGIMTYKNGDIYKGFFVNGKRHGEGFLMTKKGIKMCQWKDNEQDGEH
jgi:hypothetical protein